MQKDLGQLFPQIRRSDLLNKLSDSTLQKLSSQIQIVELNDGETLFCQGDDADGIYLVVSGQLKVSISDNGDLEDLVGVVGPNEYVGEIQAIAGGKRTACVCALCKTKLLKIDKTGIEFLASEAPDVFRYFLKIARNRLRNDQLRSFLPRHFGTLEQSEIEFIKNHIEWIHLKRGEILCRQCEPGDCLYFVISGKLKVFKDENHFEWGLDEIGRGEILGELAILTSGFRSASVIATRDSDIAKIPAKVFNKLAQNNHQVILSIGRTLAQKKIKTETKHLSIDTQINIAVVSVSQDLPIAAFTQNLIHALKVNFHTFHLSSYLINQITGAKEIQEDDPLNIRIGAWIDEQESKYDIMVYEADPALSTWTKLCLRNADKVLILVPGNSYTTVAEKKILALLQTQRGEFLSKVAVFIHQEETPMPRGSSNWLKVLSSEEHYHLRWGRESDVQRLARFITGKAINLVLSGGAACGFAHIGYIRAFEENNFPIDSISGTSMGAVIASQYAMGMKYSDMIKYNRWLWVESKPKKDITLPFISFLRGKKIEQIARSIYGDILIEDLWLPFFCVSTNLSSAQLITHREGLLFNAIRSTTSVPGLVPPVIHKSEIIVDGGIMNNLPVDIARNLFKGHIIAVDVTNAKKLIAQRSEFPSTWAIIRNMIFPPKEKIQFPNILDIFYRSALVGSRHQTDKAKLAADFCLRPPVESFRFLEFEAFDKIINAGYEDAKEKIRNWIDSGKFSHLDSKRSSN